MTVLFYTDIQRLFCSNYIGFLYQISSRYNVILLIEQLDSVILKKILDKKKFPRIIEIIEVNQWNSEGNSVFTRHFRMSKLSKKLILKYNPEIIFAAGANIFEHYLRRHGRKYCNSLSISCTNILMYKNQSDVLLLLELQEANLKYYLIPVRFGRILSRLRRKLLHLIYYIIFPILVLEFPFMKVNGIYEIDDTKFANLDFIIVFTKKNRDMLLKYNNIEHSEKLKIISHPFIDDHIYNDIYPIHTDSINIDINKKYILILLHIEEKFSYKRLNLKLIDDDLEKFISLSKSIKCILNNLQDYLILVKPHPMSIYSPIYNNTINKILSISDMINIIDPKSILEEYVTISDVLIFFPPASSAIFTTICRYPNKIIIYLDLHKELRGDSCLQFNSVYTVNSLEELSELLFKIKNNTLPVIELTTEFIDYSTINDFIESI